MIGIFLIKLKSRWGNQDQFIIVSASKYKQDNSLYEKHVLTDEKNHIVRIKKNISSNEQKISEFLGIVKFSSVGSDIFVNKYDELMKNNIGRFHEAPSLLKAYLTDMIQELVDSGIHVEPIFISGKWYEIDTLEDLRNAEKLFS